MKAEDQIRLPPPIVARGDDAADGDGGPQPPAKAKAKAKAAADGKNACASLAIDAQRGATVPCVPGNGIVRRRGQAETGPRTRRKTWNTSVLRAPTRASTMR